MLVHSVMYPDAIGRMVARIPNAATLKTFIRWALGPKGQAYGPKLLFAPIGKASPVVLRASLKALAQIHS